MSGRVEDGRVVIDGDWWPLPVPENVVIEEPCWLYSSFAFLHYRSTRPAGVKLGANSAVYDGTVFELGPDGEVEIGEYCTLVTPTISTNGRVEIDDYSLISSDVWITDSPWAVPPDVADRVRGPGPSPTITIGRNVWVGTRVVLLAGCSLGDGSIVGAGSVVDFEVPPYAIVAGNPARIVGSSPPRRQDGRPV